MGFATSLLISFYDVILKEYANFIELVLTVALARLLFGTELKFALLVAVVIAGYSLLEYTKEEDRLSREQRRQTEADKDSASQVQLLARVPIVANGADSLPPGRDVEAIA